MLVDEWTLSPTYEQAMSVHYSQRLCQAVSNHQFSMSLFKSNHPILNQFPGLVIFYRYMLCFAMVFRILCQLDSSLVISKNGGR